MKITNNKIHLKVTVYTYHTLHRKNTDSPHHKNTHHRTHHKNTQHSENSLVAKAKNPWRHCRIDKQESRSGGSSWSVRM